MFDSAALPPNRRLLLFESSNDVPSSISGPLTSQLNENQQQKNSQVLFFDPSHGAPSRAASDENKISDGAASNIPGYNGYYDQDVGTQSLDLYDDQLESLQDPVVAPFSDDSRGQAGLPKRPIFQAVPATTPSPLETTTLVKDQIKRIEPDTVNLPNAVGTLKPVQQSLADALNSDISSLYKAYDGKEEEIYATMKTLYEDYNLMHDASKISGKSMAFYVLSDSSSESVDFNFHSIETKWNMSLLG